RGSPSAPVRARLPPFGPSPLPPSPRLHGRETARRFRPVPTPAQKPFQSCRPDTTFLETHCAPPDDAPNSTASHPTSRPLHPCPRESPPSFDARPRAKWTTAPRSFVQGPDPISHPAPLPLTASRPPP